MKFFYFLSFVIILFLFSCKKDKIQNEENGGGGVITTKIVPLPDSALFVGTSIRDSSTIYILNASTGDLTNTYRYPNSSPLPWCIPYVGNGFLYAVDENRINALNIQTGAILWTDSLKNNFYFPPIFHVDTFYGLYTNIGSTPYVYALDATKKSGTFLWKYTLNNPISTQYDSDFARYYNGILYVNGSTSLTALDAKTGTVKFTVKAPYSLSSLKRGIIISGNTLLDASSGTQVGVIPSSLLPTSANQISSMIYTTGNSFFTRVVKSISTTFAYSSTSFINFYDSATGSLKWSINGGNNAFNSDTTRLVDQIFNNQVIIKSRLSVSAGIYGAVNSNTFSGYDVNTGQLKWTYAAGIEGRTFVVGNMQYSNGTLTLNAALGQPASSSLIAADLNTGKIRWSNNKLYVANSGSSATCLYTAGAGYSYLSQ